MKGFNINFVTPTYFNTSMGDYPVRFPIPVILFGNFADLCNDICQEKSEIDRENFLNWVNAHV